MSDEPSPRPWQVSDGFLDRYSTGHRDIVDARGELVAVRVSSVDAALIVDAVNGLRSEDAPAGFDPYCACHGCPNCRIYARLQEAKKKEESK